MEGAAVRLPGRPLTALTEGPILSVTTPVLAHIDVPEHAFDGAVPLVTVMRGEYVGGLHRGMAAAVDSAGDELIAIGDTGQRVFLRSGAKPFQLMPAVLSGAVDRFGVTQQELAVLAASHHGEQGHIEAVYSVLAKAGLEESALHCGIHPPLSEEAARVRWREGKDPSPVCNNCSGAHTGMLLACLTNGWPLDSYGLAGHPLQIETRAILATFAGMPEGEIQLAVDNCDVPTFRIPLRSAALAFARLASGAAVPTALATAARRIRDAMTSHPTMVGGTVSFDSALMAAARGQIVCKGGAEAFQGVGIVAPGAGVALKVADGGSRAVPPACLAILSQLGALNSDARQSLIPYFEPDVRNRRGEVVGCLRPAFHFEPGA